MKVLRNRKDGGRSFDGRIASSGKEWFFRDQSEGAH